MDEAARGWKSKSTTRGNAWLFLRVFQGVVVFKQADGCFSGLIVLFKGLRLDAAALLMWLHPPTPSVARDERRKGAADPIRDIKNV